MEKGARIGQGRTAEIFAWGEGTILKLFRPEFSSAETSAHEAELARAIYAAGAPSPAVGDVVEVEGRAGVIYERIDGPSLEALVTAKPWLIAQGARTLAETQVAVQSCALPTLPPLRKFLQQRIQLARPLTPALRAAALDALERLPDGSALCHGDLHPGNVLLSRRGRASDQRERECRGPAEASASRRRGGPLVIDWENATCGHLLADVARTLLMIRMGWLHPKRAVQQGIVRGAGALYVRRYCQLRPATRQEIDVWELPIAAARLCEDIAVEEPHLLALVARLVLQRDFLPT